MGERAKLYPSVENERNVIMNYKFGAKQIEEVTSIAKSQHYKDY